MAATTKEIELEHFLNFNNTTFIYESEHWIKFELRRVEESEARPHGLKYSLTLHRGDGTRILGFDNAHAVGPQSRGYKKMSAEYDHWHRTEFDEGRPYIFQDLPQLFQDFFEAVDETMKAEL